MSNKGFVANIVLVALAAVLAGGGLTALVKSKKTRALPAPSIPNGTQLNQVYTFKNGDKLTLKSIVSSSSYALAQKSCLPTDPPSITVISPNGGETFGLGQNMNVSWSSCKIGPGTVGIELIPAPATIPYPETYPLKWTSNDGTETVTLNIDLLGRSVPAGNYKLLIPQPPETPPGVEDMSDGFFSIQ